MADVNKEMVESVQQAGGPATKQVILMAWSAFTHNPIKMGFLGLMLFFGWQMVQSQKNQERISREHRDDVKSIVEHNSVAAEKAHNIFIRSLDKLDSSINKMSDKVDANTRAMLEHRK